MKKLTKGLCIVHIERVQHMFKLVFVYRTTPWPRVTCRLRSIVHVQSEGLKNIPRLILMELRTIKVNSMFLSMIPPAGPNGLDSKKL
jgi:hypothetical protein